MKPLQGLWAAALRWTGPTLLLAAIWWPEWAHYRIDRSTDVGLLAMAAPPSPQYLQRLAELGAIDLAETDSHAVTAQDIAQAIDRGSLQIPRLSQGRWPLQGYPQDILQGPPTFRLFMASLSVERLLLAAWRDSGQTRWLQRALERVSQFAQYEATRRHDRGFLWNDHAVAGRAGTLILAWLALQEHPDLRSAHAQSVLALAQRTGRMLAKPDQFTVRTNHGVMQNLALLQLAAAFPHLPEASTWRELADARLRLQLGFYVSNEGVVLEHSPGYHFMGTRLMHWAQRLRNLNGLPADPQFDAARDGTGRVLADLLRPDGTLPAIGNTDGHTIHGRALADSSARPASAQYLYPVSGWGLWWTGRGTPTASQLMFTWAHHQGHGHKHADEGAFTWWAAGQSWITAVGYFPYGDPLVRRTYDWPGANAPHGTQEAAGSARTTRLLAQGETTGMRLADMERQRPDGGKLRRTLLQMDGATVLALDFHEAVGDGVATYWTFGPDVTMRPGPAANTWSSDPRADGWRLFMALDSTVALRTRSDFPVPGLAAGWTTVQREPRQVTTVKVVADTPRAATATLFHLGNVPSHAARVTLSPDARPERWKVDVQWADRHHLLERDGSRLHWRPADAAPADASVGSLNLEPVPLGTAAAALRQAFDRAVQQFPPWRDLWDYRENASAGVLALACALEAGRWWRRRRQTTGTLRRHWEVVATLSLWLVAATVVLAVYLRV